MTEDKCYCGRPLDEVAWDQTPCCHRHLCWDFCLYNHMDGQPFRCPYCNTTLQVADEPEGDYGKDYMLVRTPEDDPEYGPAIVAGLLKLLRQPGIPDRARESAIFLRATHWAVSNRSTWPLEAPPMRMPD